MIQHGRLPSTICAFHFGFGLAETWPTRTNSLAPSETRKASSLHCECLDVRFPGFRADRRRLGLGVGVSSQRYELGSGSGWRVESDRLGPS